MKKYFFLSDLLVYSPYDVCKISVIHNFLFYLITVLEKHCMPLLKNKYVLPFKEEQVLF